MNRGVPIISQGVLRNAEMRIYGSPDLLVRNDVLAELFPDLVVGQPMMVDLDTPGILYRVVDIKYSTLGLNAAGTQLGNSGSAPAYKAQVMLYNAMLGKLQGYTPPESYVLGRGWQRRQRGETYRSDDALSALGVVPQGDENIWTEARKGVDWIREMRRDGAGWQILPVPTRKELYPNMGGAGDWDMEDDESHEWYPAKKYIAEKIGELTLLWKVGAGKRDDALRRGIHRWDEPGLTASKLNIHGENTSRVLDGILQMNTGGMAGVVSPHRVGYKREDWISPGLQAEFYVDFETVSDLDDDFAKLPLKNGQPLIYMIGCGHIGLDGEWDFRVFTVNDLTEDEELRIIREWVDHMDYIEAMSGTGIRIYHWSNAELSVLEKAHSSARERHGSNADWPWAYDWFDLCDLFKRSPIIVRGAMAFGLKAVAKAMKKYDLIEAEWPEGPVADGMGAMMAGWHIARWGGPMSEHRMMKQVAEYNEVDCRAMMEILRYLRMNH